MLPQGDPHCNMFCRMHIQYSHCMLSVDRSIQQGLCLAGWALGSANLRCPEPPSNKQRPINCSPLQMIHKRVYRQSQKGLQTGPERFTDGARASRLQRIVAASKRQKQIVSLDIQQVTAHRAVIGVVRTHYCIYTHNAKCVYEAIVSTPMTNVPICTEVQT